MTTKIFGTWIFFFPGEDGVIWSVLWAQGPVNCASCLKFVILLPSQLSSTLSTHSSVCFFRAQGWLSSLDTRPGSFTRATTADRAGWGLQAGHLAWEGRCVSPDLARLPARGAQGSSTGYAPGGVAGRERLPGRGRHRRRIAGTTHLDQRHGGRRAQGGLPREEGECSSASRPRGCGDSGAGGGWTRGRGWGALLLANPPGPQRRIRFGYCGSGLALAWIS